MAFTCLNSVTSKQRLEKNPLNKVPRVSKYLEYPSVQVPKCPSSALRVPKCSSVLRVPKCPVSAQVNDCPLRALQVLKRALGLC